MASLKDLASKVKDAFLQATPATAAWFNIQKALPNLQAPIQRFAQNNPGVAGALIKTEPFFNAINPYNKIPERPFNFQPVQDNLQKQLNIKTGLKPLDAAVNTPINLGLGFGKSLAETYANAPFQALYNMYQYPQSKNVQQAIGRSAGIIEPLLALTTPKQVASTIKQSKNLQRLGDALKEGFSTGSQFGGFFSTLTGLRENQDSKSVGEQIMKTLPQTLTGTVVGGVAGSALSGASNVVGKVTRAIEGEAKTRAIREAESIAKYSNRQRAVIFRGKTQKEIEDILYDYYKNKSKQGGAIDFSAKVGEKLEVPPDIQKTLDDIDNGVFVNPRRYAKAMQWEEAQRRTTSGVIPPSSGTPRGFTTSVQEASEIAPGVKGQVTGTYTPKSNKTLMGEAQALLQDGASLDLNKIQNADQKVAATIQEAINQQKKNPQLAANLFNNLSEQGTELGRGVQAFSLLEKMSPESIALSAAGKIKEYNKTAIRKIPELTGEQVTLIGSKVDAIRKLADGRKKNIAINELSNIINSFVPSSIADKAITVWKAGLLTSLRTHERNLLGNTLMGVSEAIKDPFAAGADILMQQATGKRSMTPTLKGSLRGAGKGAIAAKDITLLGYDPEQTISKFDVKSINWGSNPIEQFLKRATDAVYRPLAGEDKVFWHSAYARSLYDQAGAAAINAGKRGNKSFIEKLVKNPTVEMATNALKDANAATFHDKNVLSSVANSIKRAAQSDKLGPIGSEIGKVLTEVIAPFTGVPSSIAGKTIAYSPIGLIKGAMNVGRVMIGQVPELQRQAAQEIGRGVVGTGLFGLGAYLMSKGLMTGQPKDTQEAQLWQAQNKPSNSIFFQGQWRNIGSIGPQSLILLAGAKLKEEMGKPDGSLSAYGANLARDQLAQTFLQGVQQPLAAINDPARYGKSYVGNLASSVIPNIVKDASNATDKTAREQNTISDYVKAKIPFVRTSMLPKRDVLGNEIAQEPTGIAAFFDLFNSKTPVDNAVVRELERLYKSGNEATPSKLTQSQTIRKEKVKLTFEQLDQLEKGVGEALKPQLQALVAAPSYQLLDDEQKAQAIEKITTTVRSQVKNGGGVTSSFNNVFIVNKNGNVQVIDKTFQPTIPQMTGLEELDKKAISQFNGEITQKANDIYDLYVAGEYTQDEANTELMKLKDLKLSYSKGKKPKKISIKKISSRKFKISMPKAAKIQNIKIAKLGKPKASRRSKAISFSIKPIKNVRLKGLTSSQKLV